MQNLTYMAHGMEVPSGAPPPGADSTGLEGTPLLAAAPSVDESAWQLLSQSDGPMHVPGQPTNLATVKPADAGLKNVDVQLHSAARSAQIQDSTGHA